MIISSDPAVVGNVLNKELAIVCNQWRNNRMILNNGRARLWFCRVSPKSSSPCLLKEGICRKKILDNSLSFGKQIGKISKKVGKQQDTFSRLKNILSFSNIVPQSTLCNSFTMSHLNYCSSISLQDLKSAG